MDFAEMRRRIKVPLTTPAETRENWDDASLEQRYLLLDEFFDHYVACLASAGFAFEELELVREQRRAFVELLADLIAFANVNQLDFAGAIAEAQRRHAS